MTPKRTATIAILLALALPASAQTKGPYEVKSGILEQAAPMTTQVVYFDDYGLKKATYTTMEMMGAPASHKLDLELPDGTTYEIDLDDKTGTMMRIPPEAAQAMAAAMAPAMLKDVKVKDLPAKEFLGRKCKGAEGEAMGMLTRAWTYKGIILYSEVSSAAAGPGKPIVFRATKLTEGPVPAEKFKVPAGVKIQGGNE
jgi:hypothetical protein